MRSVRDSALPWDTVKNRHQAVLGPSSSWEAVRSLFGPEGVRGFYRGAGPLLLRAFPANAGAFLGYEATLAVLVKVRQEL